MEKITQFKFSQNKTKKINRWLGKLLLCMMILAGSIGYSNTIQPEGTPSYLPLVYCTPIYSSGCVYGDDISNVSLQGESVTLNNSTTACSANAYQNYTALPAPDLAPGNSYTVSVSTSYSFASSEEVKVWIDYNNDETFSADELIANTNGNGLPSSGTGVFSFTVPTGVAAGDYRMRVRLVYYTDTFGPCDSDDYGETEDYTISIIQLDNCTGTPNAGLVTSPINICAGNSFTLTTTGATAPADGLLGIWQSSPAGMNTWTDVAGASSVTQVISAGVLVDTDFRYKLTCTHSNQTVYSDVAQVIMNPGTDCYCTPVYTWGCDNGARINNVITTSAITNINNTNTACGSTTAPIGYSDYTASHQMSVGRGMAFEIEVGVSNYSGGVKVWIDYNKDGFFSADELVTASAATIANGDNHTATILVPTTALVGETRMRVRVVESSTTFDACGSANYGEAEDYAVEIIQLDDCVGTPTAGTVTSPIYACANISFTLTTLGATAPADGLIGIWQSSPAGMDVWTDVVGAISTTHVMSTGVASNTDFRYKLTCTNSNETDISDTISVFMNDAVDCYCIPVGTNTSYYINDFTTTGGSQNISNTSSGLSANGYGDFYLFHNVSQEVGDVVNFEAIATGGTSGFKIWADWNQNGSFDDDGELVYASSGYQSTHSGSFTIPNDATAGQTRMRIGNASFTSTGPTTPCLTNLSGEYEDYMITVIIPDCTKPFNLALDAITVSSATISWTSPGALFDVELGEEGFFQSGIPTETGVSNPYTINNLDSSTTYEIYVRQDCGANGYSNWAGPFSFTTQCQAPTITSVTGDNICGEGQANLAVVTDGDVVSWYTAQTGGIKIGDGATFTTPVNTETTSYYAEAGFIVPNVTAQIGTATTTSTGSGSPYYHGWGGVKTQYIYKVEELLAAGLNSGPITSISFDVTSAGSNLTDFTIYIGTTTQNLATSTHVSGLTLVYSNPGLATTVGINTYALTGTFVWDGTSNIVVQTSFSNVNTGGTSASTRYHVPGSNLTTYTYADNRTAQQILDTMTGGVSDGNGTSGGTSTSSNRANIYINGNGICASERTEVLATVTIAPDFALSQTTLEICEADTSDVITVTTGATDYDTYTWAPNTGVNGNATDGWSFDPTETTTYVLSASQSTGAACLSTIQVQVNVNPLPMPITAEATDSDICEDTIVALTVTGNINNGIAVLGNGTTAPGNTSYPNPFSAFYGGAKHQMLYTATELTAQGMMAGSEISVVTFDFASVTGGNCVDFTIRMGATTATVMTGFVTGTTTVYGPTTFTPASAGVGLESFTLTTPYVWDGVSNLIVETIHNAGNYGNGSGTTNKVTTTNDNSVYFASSDGITGGIAGFESEMFYDNEGLSKQRPNMTFTYTFEQTNITWSPATNLYTDAAATTAYVADDYATTVYFKADAAGAMTYTATSFTDEGCSVSDSIDVTVNQTPDAPVATSPQSIVDGQTIADIIVVGNNLTWYTDEDLTDEVDASTILTEGSYTFYVTSSMGDCTSEATMIVVEVTLSTKDFDTASFKAYPNPVKDYFNISYSKDIQNIAVVNMLGQTVFTKTVNATDTQIDMTALPTGSYFVKVNVDGAVKTIKVVKQ